MGLGGRMGLGMERRLRVFRKWRGGLDGRGYAVQWKSEGRSDGGR
jgi:hypothetical protein